MANLIIACVPKKWADLLAPGKYPDNVPDSTYVEVLCPECKEAMWLGARCAAKVAEGAEAVCMGCLIDNGRLPADPEHVQILI